MLDFNHILNTPGYDVQYFTGANNSSIGQWQTWKKPRGIKYVYMIAVGGGSSGGCGVNTAATSGGGAGGASGSQTALLIPAMFIPDSLYVSCGAGGRQPATLVSGAAGVTGISSVIGIAPNVVTAVPEETLITAAAGNPTGSATTTTGGTAGSAGAAMSIASAFLAGRGRFTGIAGNAGTAGGASTGIGGPLTTPSTGICVTGGVGGGGTDGTNPRSGGPINEITGLTGFEYYPQTLTGGSGAIGATPADNGKSGFQVRNQLLNYGGTGGGGASGTAGGIAGAGGDGAPGCGGGGAGGSTLTNPTLARPGNGGNGFVYIISW